MGETVMLLFLYRLLRDAVTFCILKQCSKKQQEALGTITLQEV